MWSITITTTPVQSVERRTECSFPFTSLVALHSISFHFFRSIKSCYDFLAFLFDARACWSEFIANISACRPSDGPTDAGPRTFKHETHARWKLRHRCIDHYRRWSHHLPHGVSVQPRDRKARGPGGSSRHAEPHAEYSQRPIEFRRTPEGGASVDITNYKQSASWTYNNRKTSWRRFAFDLVILFNASSSFQTPPLSLFVDLWPDRRRLTPVCVRSDNHPRRGDGAPDDWTC